MVLMSAFMGPDQNLKPPLIETTNLKVPWIWGHGDADPIVPYAMGKWSSDALKKVRLASTTQTVIHGPSSQQQLLNTQHLASVVRRGARLQSRCARV